mmetsp:Transcript_40099/g.125549  ORF Transcript_40099/g.125549 Transcript_40099/m.125549 type:complete len:237 (-) Transcript_40099:166-876(-)
MDLRFVVLLRSVGFSSSTGSSVFSSVVSSVFSSATASSAAGSSVFSSVASSVVSSSAAGSSGFSSVVSSFLEVNMDMTVPVRDGRFSLAAFSSSRAACSARCLPMATPSRLLRNSVPCSLMRSSCSLSMRAMVSTLDSAGEEGGKGMACQASGACPWELRRSAVDSGHHGANRLVVLNPEEARNNDACRARQGARAVSATRETARGAGCEVVGGWGYTPVAVSLGASATPFLRDCG